MQPAFDIDDIGPTGIGDIWRATLTVRLEDKIDGETAYQVMTTTVRFSQKASEPISSMLDKARSLAVANLEAAASFLSTNSIEDALKIRD